MLVRVSVRVMGCCEGNYGWGCGWGNDGAEVPVRWWVLMTGWRLKDVYSNPHINAHYTPAPPHSPHRSHSRFPPGSGGEKGVRRSKDQPLIVPETV